MKFICLLLFVFSTTTILGQTALDAPLPDKFGDLEKMIIVNHFPSPVLASSDPDNPDTYFWKHNTSVFSPVEQITVIEGGAYIFYNNQWNLRITYTAKDFSKLFDIPGGKMKAGEPFTFAKNWRGDSRLLGGWAMWYVIGETASGKKVYGIGKLETAEKTYQ